MGVSSARIRDGRNLAQASQVEEVVAKQKSLRNRWTSQAFKTNWWRIRNFGHTGSKTTFAEREGIHILKKLFP